MILGILDLLSCPRSNEDSSKVGRVQKKSKKRLCSDPRAKSQVLEDWINRDPNDRSPIFRLLRVAWRLIAGIRRLNETPSLFSIPTRPLYYIYIYVDDEVTSVEMHNVTDYPMRCEVESRQRNIVDIESRLLSTTLQGESLPQALPTRVRISNRVLSLFSSCIF